MTTGSSTYSTEVGTTLPAGNFTATFPVTTQDYVTTQEYVTTTEESDSIPEYVGFIAVIIAILFYGITYAPVKKFDTGDGKYTVQNERRCWHANSGFWILLPTK